jgi:hypothetical protein
MWLESL